MNILSLHNPAVSATSLIGTNSTWCVNLRVTAGTYVLWLAIKGFLRFSRYRALRPCLLSFLPQVIVKVFPATVWADFAVEDVGFRA